MNNSDTYLVLKLKMLSLNLLPHFEYLSKNATLGLLEAKMFIYILSTYLEYDY